MSTLKALYFYNNYFNVAPILLQSNPNPPNWFRIAFGDSSQGYLLQEVLLLLFYITVLFGKSSVLCFFCLLAHVWWFDHHLLVIGLLHLVVP